VKLRITIDGKSYEAEVEVLEEEEATPLPYTPPPIAYPATPVPVALPHVHATAPREFNEKEILSPVTGLVIRINVTSGAAVEANDVLLVLEAMKMETQVIAHRAGTVKAVHAVAGKPVKIHQVLVEME
jgi:methylmalonyl-CoA carboxyltransferase small subunit